MSLSRFQTVLWSVLILSAFQAAALTNISLVSNPTYALTINIPPEVLAILGISVTSLVGKSVILNAVKDPAQVDTNLGTKDRPSWFDMFKGDDVGNADYVDLSKVQMFYITLILVLVYGVALASMFMVVDPKHSAISTLPALTSSVVGLLGISQGGYLVYKAIPHDQTNGKSAIAVSPLTTSNQVPTAADQQTPLTTSNQVPAGADQPTPTTPDQK